MANIYDPEEVTGSVEIKLESKQTPGDVRDKFSFSVRREFKNKGQRVKNLKLEVLEEDAVDKKATFYYVAEVYDYDFAETESFWKSYGEMLRKQY